MDSLTRDAASTPPFERLRPFFSRATILSLVEVSLDGPRRRNINTTVVYGTERMRLRSHRPLMQSSRDASRSGQFWASIVVVDAGAADAFIEQTQTTIAMFPESDVEIAYDLESPYDGFIPRGDFADSSYDQMPGGAPSWRRRFPPQSRSVNGVTVEEAHLADIVAELPKFLQIEYEPLNLEHALDRIGALDVLYPSHVRAAFHGEPSGVRYEIEDSLEWIERLGTPTLAMEFGQLGMLVGARTIIPLAADTIEMDPPHSARHCLTVGGIVLDGSGGTFVRIIQTQLGIMEPDIAVKAGGATASIPVTPRNTQRSRVGNAEPLRDVFGPRHLAKVWREQMEWKTKHVEHVFDGANDAKTRAKGLELLSEIIRSEIDACEAPAVVLIVDPFGLGIETLKAMIPLAAGAPNGELWLLSNNSDAPPSSLVDFVLREVRKFIARLRKMSLQDVLDEAFAHSASVVAKQLKVKIRWYKPNVPLHDRFLKVGERIWHVGHSFNRFGCDLSAIIEFRDLEEKARLLRIFDEQFSVGNLKGTFE